MNKTEMLNQLEKLKQERKEIEKRLNELEENISNLKKDIFNPYIIKKEETNYYSINKIGNIITENNNNSMDIHYTYNKFNSKKYAELRQKEMDLQDKMWAFSYVYGWKNEYLLDIEAKKYYIIHDISNNRFMVTLDCCLYSNNIVYFTSKEVAEKAIKEFGDEIIKLYTMRSNMMEGEI